MKTDQGRNFESALFRELANILGSHRIHSVAYQPQSNGLTERLHRHLKSSLVSPENPRWTEILPLVLLGGRGGLVARSQPRDQRVASSKPDSTEDPLCMGPAARQIIRSDQTPSRWCGAEAWRGRCQLRHYPRHLTMVQNYEVCP
ncbi:hypothetical protein AVEN_63879-1 [Araneus ventricosus]|nr:hypothetical protein AVEN_237075-1 [Araneus ventricosus]GBN53580.1 hypothetical protein AVEN_63879-1 [Araneus ventricosus]